MDTSYPYRTTGIWENLKGAIDSDDVIADSEKKQTP